VSKAASEAEEQKRQAQAIYDAAMRLLAATDMVQTHVARGIIVGRKVCDMANSIRAQAAFLPMAENAPVGLDEMLVANANLLEQSLEVMSDLTRDCSLLMMEMSGKEAAKWVDTRS